MQIKTYVQIVST